MGARPLPVGWRLLGLIPFVLGVLGLLACVREFYVSGKGTLAPWSPPRNLVMSGFYRYSRNPMYVSVLLVLIGWSVLFGGRLLWRHAGSSECEIRSPAHRLTDRCLTMAGNKTKATNANVKDHLASVASVEQLADCKALIELMSRITGAKPKMWGPSIVGFGQYHYRYDSGREGDACVTGFAVRGRELVMYLMTDGRENAKLLAKLGKHRTGKSCLYIRQLRDVDVVVLEQLIAGSVAAVEARYGQHRGGEHS